MRCVLRMHGQFLNVGIGLHIFILHIDIHVLNSEFSIF